MWARNTKERKNRIGQSMIHAVQSCREMRASPRPIGKQTGCPAGGQPCFTCLGVRVRLNRFSCFFFPFRRVCVCVRERILVRWVFSGSVVRVRVCVCASCVLFYVFISLIFFTGVVVVSYRFMWCFDCRPIIVLILLDFVMRSSAGYSGEFRKPFQ